MKKFILTLLSLSVGIVLPGFAQLTATPEQKMGYEYFAFTCLTLDGGGNCMPNQVITPVPGVFVTLYVTARTGSGDHSHETTQTNRPPIQFITNARLQTGEDGKVHWKFYNNGFAGTYDVIMAPEDSGGHHFPTLVTTFISEVTTMSKNGAIQYFAPFTPGTYGSGAPTDIKHRTETGQTGISTYGTKACVQNLQTATRRYYLIPDNVEHRKMALWRGSIRKGGLVDNEIDINGAYLFTGTGQEWTVRNGEIHYGGRSFDFVNPELYETMEIRKAAQFSAWRRVLRSVGMRFGVRDSWGRQIGDGGETAASMYWNNQNLIHMVCLYDPVAPQ